mmetsp:Transcript_104942/g.182237  ORF Transcript_104942/g.182237 Transcript_104942/m.182237 type:complete len:98 (+) Transcript_104942:353-646(+)
MPNLELGSYCSNIWIKLVVAELQVLGNSTAPTPCMILDVALKPEPNGNILAMSSKVKTPKAHQSTARVYLMPISISGAMYSNVPQVVEVLPLTTLLK